MDPITSWAAIAAALLTAWIVLAETRGRLNDTHDHDYQLIGHGGAGWHLYRCSCGKEEIS